MAMKVEILNKQVIKPSSPTPPKLHHFSLSLLDQLSTAVYVPVILFFSGAGNFSDRSDRLKKSLSETLTRFYPLAGRARDNSFIHCNDDGVDYIEARANCLLSHFLTEPMPDQLGSFLPIQTESDEAATGRIFLVQVTLFECGGIAIGVSFSHKLVDASSISVILKSWSAAALGSDTAEPLFLQDSLLPPPPQTPIKVPPVDLGAKVKCISRRLLFTGSKLSDLKAAAASAAVPNPTRVEAITALIWKSAVKASSKPPPLSAVSQTVNLRKRLTPPLPENSIGNLIGNFIAGPTPNGEKNLQGLVELLREGMREFKKSGVKRYEGEDAFMKILGGLQESGGLFVREDVGLYMFSSWTGFGLYEVDFGWGKPAWVSFGSVKFLNFVVLMDARDGEGIEAWVTLEEEEMGLFEKDEDLLQFAVVNPSVVL